MAAVELPERPSRPAHSSVHTAAGFPRAPRDPPESPAEPGSPLGAAPGEEPSGSRAKGLICSSQRSPPPPTGLSARVLNPDVLTPHGAFPRLPALMLWRQQPSPGNKTQRWETTGVVRLFASVPPGTSSPRTAAGALQRSGVVRARTGGSTASCTDRAWRALTRDPAGVRNWEWHEGDRHSHMRAARHKPQ